MLFEISDEDLEYIKEQALIRYYCAPELGFSKKKEPYEHANDCIGEWCVCEALDVEWGGDIRATVIGDLIVKAQRESWHGLTMSYTENPHAVYVLISPEYNAEYGNAWRVRGWTTRERAMRNQSGIKRKEHYIIVPKENLEPIETLGFFLFGTDDTIEERCYYDD